ncbi:uncharacterized protein LY89DRAFT_237321 [Mollisia scopiformis]|uniref:Secreted protein n=1 Tax=Mollisia scopiformis TaxID=149040 RepID=A0A194WT42_MOLSC|nr:uncharacterized protein LY89DRAFT_237321 [Mollisia scopiformis]KUJ11123.1 hypothetical protein LY89DRAFT_237321 [Mollisia scopiformis]
MYNNIQESRSLLLFLLLLLLERPPYSYNIFLGKEKIPENASTFRRKGIVLIEILSAPTLILTRQEHFCKQEKITRLRSPIVIVQNPPKKEKKRHRSIIRPISL